MTRVVSLPYSDAFFCLHFLANAPKRLAFDVLLTAFVSLGGVQPSPAQTLEEPEDSVTIERPCRYGEEIEVVAKKGDIVRLTFPENPSGRREFLRCSCQMKK